jgi:hypothetical protein
MLMIAILTYASNGCSELRVIIGTFSSSNVFHNNYDEITSQQQGCGAGAASFGRHRSSNAMRFRQRH